jgi:predicted phage tail protein
MTGTIPAEIAAFLARMPAEMRAELRSQLRAIDALHAKRAALEERRAKPGTRVQITLVPMGGSGKNPLRIVLSLAVIAASFAFGQAIGGLIVGGVGSNFLGMTVTAGLQSAVGGFLIPCGGPLLIAPAPPSKEALR